MELLEQQRPPIHRLAGGASEGDRQLGLPQQTLQGAVVALLVGAAGGAAAVQLQVQLIAPHRQARHQGLQPLQVLTQGAVGLGGGLGLGAPERQLLEHRGGGAATVVTDTGQPEKFRHAGGGLPGQALLLDRQRVAVGADRRGHQRQQLSPAGAPPAEQAMGEAMAGVPGELVGAEPAHVGGGGHGGQAGGEAEAVGQPGQLVRPFGEGAAAVVLALLELAQQRGSAHQHAVALHPGAIERLPAPGPHCGADGGEQGGPVLLQPGVEGGGGMAEVELREALHQGQGGNEGALGRPPGVGHGPQPGQIEMGVTEHPHRPLGHRLGPPPPSPQAPQGLAAGGQQVEGVGRIDRLELDAAVDQGAVVMERAAQAQLQGQGFAGPPALGQGPAAGGVKQVAGQHRLPIHPQLGRIGPPAQRQPGAGHGGAERAPGRRAEALQVQDALLAAAGPDDQAAGGPVGPVARAPGVDEGTGAATPGGVQPPKGLQIDGVRIGRLPIEGMRIHRCRRGERE